MGKRGRTVAEEKKIEGRRHIFFAVTDRSIVLMSNMKALKLDCRLMKRFTFTRF